VVYSIYADLWYETRVRAADRDLFVVRPTVVVYAHELIVSTIKDIETFEPV